MSATPIASTSPERVTHAPKTAQSKQSSVAQGSAPVDFAALLLQADQSEVAEDTSLVSGNAINQDDVQRHDRSADTSPPSGEMVLAGLLNWRNFAEASGTGTGTGTTTAATTAAATTAATTAAATTAATTTATAGANVPTTPMSADVPHDSPFNPSAWLSQTDQPLSGVSAANSTEPNTPLGMREKEGSLPVASLTRAQTTTTDLLLPRTPLGPTSNPGVAETTSTLSTAGETVTDDLATMNLVTTRDPGAAAVASTVNNPATGLAGKSKAGTLRHALSTSVGTSTGTSTGALQSAPPSTVALGTREAMLTPTTNAFSFSTTDKGSGAEKEPDAAIPGTGSLAADSSNPSLKWDRTATAEATPPSVTGSADVAMEPFTPPSPDAPTPTAPEGMEQAMEELGAQIAYWSTQGNQRASLTIGEGSNAPLDVKIAFENGAVHVQFETDESEVRDALNLSAEDTLNRMLEARGMSLGDVSIGSGQAKESPSSAFSDSGQQEPSRASSLTHSASASTGTSPTVAGAPRRPESIISANKLDFFA